MIPIVERNIAAVENTTMTMTNITLERAKLLKGLDLRLQTSLREAVTVVTETEIMRAREVETRTSIAMMIAKSRQVTDPIGLKITIAHDVVTEIVTGIERIAKTATETGTVIATGTETETETETIDTAVQAEEVQQTADQPLLSNHPLPEAPVHEPTRNPAETETEPPTTAAANPAPPSILILLSAKPATANAY